MTSYVRGINGIMIDVVNLANDLTVDDLSFLQWQVHWQPGSPRWIDAPLPSQVAFRPGAGVLGSDRLTLIWPDGAIVDTWLRVIVKGNDLLGGYNTHSGLAQSEEITLWQQDRRLGLLTF